MVERYLTWIWWVLTLTLQSSLSGRRAEDHGGYRYL